MTPEKAIEVLKHAAEIEFGGLGVIDLDDLTAAASHAIAALRDNPALRVDLASLSQPRRAAHVERWWRTYNAALTGLAATDEYTTDGAHQRAAAAANLAHGPLDGQP
jgi:hypothetical protein